MFDVQTPMFFNVNHYVCVRLTDIGREAHRENHTNLYARYGELIGRRQVPLPKEGWPPEYRAPAEEPDGWSEWQAWDLMKEFGSALGNGMRVPFSPEIFIGSMEQLRAELAKRIPAASESNTDGVKRDD